MKLLWFMLLLAVALSPVYASSDVQQPQAPVGGSETSGSSGVAAGDDDDGTSDTISTTSSAVRSLPPVAFVAENPSLQLLRGKVERTSVTFLKQVMVKVSGKGKATTFKPTSCTFDLHEEQIFALLELLYAQPDSVNEAVLTEVLKVDRNKTRKGHTPRVTTSSGKGYPVANDQNTSFYLESWAAMIKIMHNFGFQPACAFEAELASLKEEKLVLIKRVDHLEKNVSESEAGAMTIVDLKKQLEALEEATRGLKLTNEEETKLKIQAIREKTQAVDRINAAETARDVALAEKKEADRRLVELKRQVNATEAARAEAENKAAERVVEVQALQDRLDAAEAANRYANEKIDASVKRDGAGEELRQRLQGELAEVKQRAATAVQQANEARLAAERNTAESEAAQRALQDRLDAAVAERATAVQRVVKEKKRADEFEAARVEAESKAEDSVVKLAALQDQLDAAVAATKQEKAARLAAEAVAQQAEGANQYLKDQLNAAEAEKKCVAEFEAARVDQANEEQGVVERTSAEQLQRDLDDLRSTSKAEIQQAKREREEMRIAAERGVANAVVVKSALERERDSLRRTLEGATRRPADLERQNADLQRQVSKLQADLAAARAAAPPQPAVPQNGVVFYAKGTVKKRSQD